MDTVKIGLLGVLSVTLLLVTGCASQQGTGSSASLNDIDQNNEGDFGKSLSVVTTFPPLYAHASNLVDENDTLINLVPPGRSVHTWQPKPSDIVAMEEADVIITNGLGLESFLEGYLETLENKGVLVVDTSEGAELIEYEDDHDDDDHNDDDDENDDDHSDEEDNDNDDHDDDEEHDDDDDHDHEGDDPHIWLDPSNAQIQVVNIARALGMVDPQQEDFYNQQATRYNDDIAAMDASIAEMLTTDEIGSFIVFHDAYQYFLKRYDITDKQVGMVQEFHGDNPSQQAIASLIETIQSEGVSILYTEPQFNPSVVQRLEEETGVTTRAINPIGDLLDNDGYISMMNALADAFTP